MSAAATPALSEPPRVRDLFYRFLIVGLTGFGGVLPMARHMLVVERRWLTAQEFTDLLGLCQFLPGGNIINMSIAIGLKFRGVAGAVASITGLIAAPTAVVIGLGVIYDRFQADPRIQHLFAGLAAVAAGMLVATAVKIVQPLRGKWVAIAMASICFLAIAVLRVPLLLTMLVLAPLSIVATWRAGR